MKELTPIEIKEWKVINDGVFKKMVDDYERRDYRKDTTGTQQPNKLGLNEGRRKTCNGIFRK